MRRRTTILLTVLAGLLCLAMLWCQNRQSRQKQRALAAMEGLAECRRIAARIRQARRRPALAAERELLGSQITSLIENAARSAGITPDRLVSITPQRADRVGESVYKEKPTLVSLKGVTLKQLVTMVHKLVSSADGLYAERLWLAAPRPQDTGNLWDAELTLTYLIYDPPNWNK